MEGNQKKGLFEDEAYRIRSMSGLIAQIREDHKALQSLWKEFETGRIDIGHIDEIVKVLSWLRQETEVLTKLRNRGIEGISWGELHRIHKDIGIKENNLKMILFSVSKETVDSHLR